MPGVLTVRCCFPLLSICSSRRESGHPAIAAAEDIAEHLLFPDAVRTDAADLAPREHFERLAEAGLYGLAAPEPAGGPPPEVLHGVIERLPSGCLATAFVWIQHNSPVRELAATPSQALRDAFFAPVASGRTPAGIALGGLQGGSAGLTATPAPGGWLLNGTAPYVTGWGIIEVLLTAALTLDGRVMRSLVDVRESDSMRPERLQLVAANASGTVRLHLQDHFVPEERVTTLEPYKPRPAYDGGGRGNGSLALGVARRCLALIGPSPLDGELDERRRQVDTASDDTMADARAAAAAFAVRAASALLVSRGGSSIVRGEHAERLYREAAFLLVFGTRSAIKASLLGRFGAAE